VTGLDGKVRTAQHPKLIPELAKLDLFPKVVSKLEAMPRGLQQDVARLVASGMNILPAIKQVENQREPGDEPASKKGLPKNGAPKFDLDEVRSLVGKLIREVDKLGDACDCKNTPDTDKLQQSIWQVKEEFEA